ncbi:ATP-binding protein [Romboutsia sp. 1001285H_161024_C4]|uniref:ATP-binding protein n=1 Tax=Romboutsia sp. 1001285H_161024_C4 TaxID=2787109 RepID=UPI002ED0AB8F
MKSRVFDRFVQCDKSLRRENEGSGIGLSIVKSIIELMDGKIYLKSEENIGSEFTILLPNKVLKEYNQNKVIHKDYDIDIQRIQLEFSDIYELYNESSYIL